MKAYRRAAKISFLKKLSLDISQEEKISTDLKHKFSTLKKLETVFSVENTEMLETKTLLSGIKKLSSSDIVVKDIKKLFVPDHLLCLISGDLMSDPVTLESGRTYERAKILQYFEHQREQATKALINADSDNEVIEADYMICPVNM